MTTGRRSSPVPQLNCVGGSAKGMFNPEVTKIIHKLDIKKMVVEVPNNIGV